MSPHAWLITDAAAEAGAAETLPPTLGLTVMSREELSGSDLTFTNNEKVAITTEAAMDEVVARLDDRRRAAIRTLKDKTAFREVLAPIYPDFTYETVTPERLVELDLDPDRRYVVKPSIGVFGAGVRTIQGDADLRAVRDEILAEIADNAAVLSDSALAADRLIVEQYVEGEEYAADCFFNEHGEPVITGAYHHPMPANPAYLHMVYYSNPGVWARVVPQAQTFFEALNAQLGVANLAMHAEFRLENGRLVPIEINSMRFGGMGLGNMVYHTLGINPYRHFVDGSPIDWGPLLDLDSALVFFIAYNGATVDTSIMRPDWDRLRPHFTDIVKEVPFDHQRQLAFGILYAREREDRVRELLDIEFDEIFVPV